MSPGHGFEILKNWERTKATLLSSICGSKFGTERESTVTVLSVDESRLAVVDADNVPSFRELKGAVLTVSETPESISLEVMTADGRCIRLTEILS